jgi:hypothetical protein
MDPSSEKISQFSSFSFLLIEIIVGETATSSTNNPTSQGQNASSGTGGETSTGKWVSVSARRAAGAAYSGERQTREGAYSGRESDMRTKGYHHSLHFHILILN